MTKWNDLMNKVRGDEYPPLTAQAHHPELGKFAVAGPGFCTFLTIVCSSILSANLFAAITPPSSALHILPPLGASLGRLQNFDPSLTPFLIVSICNQTDSGCLSLAELQGRGGQQVRKDQIALKEQMYQVSWQVPDLATSGKLKLSFIVAGFNVATSYYDVRARETLPIKFFVENHPRIRTRVLNARGFTASENTRVLAEEFALLDLEAATMLFEEQYGVVEIGTALREIYSSTPERCAEVLRLLGYQSVDVATALKSCFDITDLACAQILKNLAFNAAQVALALRDVYAREVSQTAFVLRSVQFTASETAVPVRDLFRLTAEPGALILKNAGYSSVEVGEALRDPYAVDASVAGGILRNVGFNSVATASALKIVFAQGVADVTWILDSSGYTLAEVARALTEVFELPPREVYLTLKTVLQTTPDEGEAVLQDIGFSSQEAFNIVLPDLVIRYEALARRYGPTIYLHPEEEYQMSSIDWYLQRSRFVYYNGVSSVAFATGAITKDTLADVERGASSRWLHPQGAFKGGDINSANSYIHALRLHDYVDLQFWIFYPFNGPGTLYSEVGVKAFGKDVTDEEMTELDQLGEHEGDWEAVILRFDRKTEELLSVIMSQHGHYQEYKTWSRADGEHVAVFASKNGHANYPIYGPNPQNLVNEEGESDGFGYLARIQLLNRASFGHAFPASSRFEMVSVDSTPIDAPWLYFNGQWGHTYFITASPGEAVEILLDHFKAPLVAAFGLACGPAAPVCALAAAGVLGVVLGAVAGAVEPVIQQSGLHIADPPRTPSDRTSCEWYYVEYPGACAK